MSSLNTQAEHFATFGNTTNHIAAGSTVVAQGDQTNTSSQTVLGSTVAGLPMSVMSTSGSATSASGSASQMAQMFMQMLGKK